MNNGKVFLSVIFILISSGIFSQHPDNSKLQRENPAISVSPLALEIELEAGQTATQTFTIENSGDSAINFSLSASLISQLKNGDPKNNHSNNVLIFKDRFAWNLDTNVPILESLGAMILIASSDEMATIELSTFDLIIFESYQTTAFYNSYRANISRFEYFLNSGGNIEFHCATNPADRIPNLEFPGGIKTLSNGSFDTYNFVTNSSHPILRNLPDSLKGNSASHEAFKNIPTTADTLTVNESGQPTSVAYNFGEGKILLTGMAWEIANNSDWNFGDILPNAFQYMLGHSGKLDWLSWNPTEGTILPGASQIIEIGFDATNLYPGIYLAEILISINDTEEPLSLLSLPITLTVTGQNPPLLLTALLDENSGEVALAWEFPVKDALLQFNIYRNGFLLNSTNSLSFTDVLSIPGTYAYEVSALYVEGESLPTPAEEIIWEGLPNIFATPLVIEETIQSGEALTKNIIISNIGDSKLFWNAAIQKSDYSSEGGNPNYQSNFLSQDKIEEIIFKNEAFKNSRGIPGIDTDEILDAHPGGSRDIILVCVVDGGNFSTETWDYLNLHWADYGEQELLIDYSSLSGIEFSYPILSNCGAQVLMIDNNWNAEESYGALSEAECQAIAEYVNEGAGLFVTGGTLNERQFPELNFQTQYFAPLLGIDPEAEFMWNRGYAAATNLLTPSHPIFQNLNKPFGSSITGTTCRPLGNNWLTALTNGDILAISDDKETAIIGYENRIYHSSAPMLMPSIENIQFAYNVINYCASGYFPLDWLSASPHYGSIPSGGSDTVKVILGNPNLYPDFYTANISLTSNDPNSASINVPVSLHVEGLTPPTNLAAELDILSGEVALSWGFQQTDSFLYFNIYRNAALIDTNTRLSCINILPNAGTYTFEVTALFSEGESAPTAPVEIIWDGNADISVEPEFILERLGTGQNSTRQLNISNSGEGELTWAIDIFEQANGDNQGGADTSGYYWIDSDEPGGPEYTWFDISEIGSNTGLLGDESFAVLALPFDFEFYGDIKNEINLFDNGFLSFGAAFNKYHNDPIPLSSAPNDLIAPFWDDLMSGDSGVCYSYFDETKHRLIIQYSNWAKYNAVGVANFQVHLHQNGSIYFYYQEFSCDVNQSTTGLENANGSDGLFIAMDGNYLHDHLAIKIVTTPAWIKSDKLSGIIPSGRNEVVDIHFDTGELSTGDYFADLILTSNDPEESSLTVPITLTITTEILPTNLSATLNDKTGTVDLNWDFEFDDDFLWFNIYRDAVLIDTSTRLHYADFLPGAGTYQYEISAVKTSVETLPSSVLEVKWEGLSDISIEPGFLEATLGAGQSSIRQLTISNSGEGKLEWALDIFALSGEIHNNNPKNNGGNFDGEKGKPDPRKGNPPDEGQGGLDAFGYSWIDSDESGGPEYSWLDISEIGSNTLLSGDDVFVTLALPFDFWFYGEAKNEILVSSNGYLTFGIDGTDYTNDPIPSVEYPNDVIAPFWTDMKSGAAGTNYSWYDEENQRLIIQYSNWEKYDGAGQATFQVHLHQNGTIYFYYENMTCDLCEATIGTENPDGIDGLEIVFNAYYLHNQLAVKITSTPKWITANTLSGIINSGENQVVDINFDATDLATANYLAEIIFSSDDPDEPILSIPVSLNVGEFQAEQHILSLNMGWTGISSFLNPAIQNIEIIMDSISDQLEMIQNLDLFYQPDNASSTLNSWNTKSGYFIKVNEETALLIQGIQAGNKSVNITEGWNLIPVLSNQPVSIETLFAGNLEKIDIIKDAVGTDIFWPQKGIATLTELKPGRAYLIKASGEFVLLFFE